MKSYLKDRIEDLLVLDSITEDELMEIVCMSMKTSESIIKSLCVYFQYIIKKTVY